MPLRDSSSLWFQHRGRVRPRRGRRGHLQDVPRPPEEPEGAGGGGEDHTSQPGHKTRDVVRPDHQLVGPGPGETSGWGCSAPVFGALLQLIPHFKKNMKLAEGVHC